MLTGHVRAEDEAAMAFRISGRMIERLVNVGDRVSRRRCWRGSIRKTR